MAVREHTFTLLGKKYKIDIPDQLEEAFRMGERRLNAQLLEKMKEKTDGYNDRDYLALAALELATEVVCLEHDNAVEPDNESLAALIEKIESTLK